MPEWRGLRWKGRALRIGTFGNSQFRLYRLQRFLGLKVSAPNSMLARHSSDDSVTHIGS